MPFINPARTDGAKLYHWRRAADEGKEYPFARFNKVYDCRVTFFVHSVAMSERQFRGILYRSQFHTTVSLKLSPGRQWRLKELLYYMYLYLLLTKFEVCTVTLQTK